MATSPSQAHWPHVLTARAIDMDTKYIKLAVNRPDYDVLLAQLEIEFKQDYPNNELSVNMNDAGSLAWVKVSDRSTYSGPLLNNTASRGEQHSSRVLAEVIKITWRAE